MVAKLVYSNYSDNRSFFHSNYSKPKFHICFSPNSKDVEILRSRWCLMLTDHYVAIAKYSYNLELFTKKDLR